jgi:hypothetical protein
MDLYIEKDFLDNFDLEYNDKTASPSQLVLYSIFKEYPEVNIYMDCDFNDTKEVESYQDNNRAFSAITKNETSRLYRFFSFDQFLEEEHKISFEQTLIFTHKAKEWFDKFKIKGVLCFSYDDYESKIQNIISKCRDIRIDLSDPSNFPFSWNKIEILQTLLPLNKIIINDSYLLRKKHLEKNLYPLIKSISKNTATSKYFWSNIFPKQDQNKKEPYFNMHDIYDLLEDKYKTSEIKIIHNNGTYYNEYLKKDEYFKDSNIQEKMKNFKFHDRLLYTNFYVIDCAIGFNFDIEKQSNSQIIIETIFEKYSYKRLKNHSKKMEDIFKLLKNEDDKFFYPKI